MNRGFTLIEVAIAVAILATGFATLTVIQGRSLDQSREEHNRLIGTLAAQFLLTHQLLQSRNLENASDRSGDLVGELQQANYFDGTDRGPAERDFAGFGFQLSFAPINYGDIQSVLMKIESRVFWDGDPARGVSVTQLITPPKVPGAPVS